MQVKKWLCDKHEHNSSSVVLSEAVSVKTSVFDYEFVAMKQGIDALKCLRYKLRMMGLPYQVPHIFMEIIGQ